MKTRFSKPQPCRRQPNRVRVRFEQLEPRLAPAVALLAVGADAGFEPRITAYDQATGAVVRDFLAFDASFRGGVRVAVGDVNADGSQDIVAAAGPGASPQVKVFDGRTGDVLRDFMAYSAAFRGGVNVAVGDVNGDGRADIITGAGAGGGPQVRVFDGETGMRLHSFFAYDRKFTGGVTVAAGDINADGRADLVTGPGRGGGPQVRVFDGETGVRLRSFFAYNNNVRHGLFVAAADLNADGLAEIVTGLGRGGTPEVRVFDGATNTNLSTFLAYDASFLGGVRVAAVSLDASGHAAVITAPGTGTEVEVRTFTLAGAAASDRVTLFAGFQGGAFVAEAGLPPILTELSGGSLGNFFEALAVGAGDEIINIQLDPLNLNLLGLQVQTSPIEVTVSVESGDGQLLGNLITVAANLVNLDGVNAALNNVLNSVVGLANSATLALDATINDGDLSTAEPSTTSVLDLFIAPVHLELLGVNVDTSPITVTIVANAGDGLILGNVVTALAHLFDPPQPELNLGTINVRLAELLAELDEQIPGIPSAPVDPVVITSNSEVLRLVVPPIDLDLLGLNLQTEQIRVNVDAQTGSGELLGNVVTTLLDALEATPEERQTLSNNLNALLARVVGILNVTNLVLPAGAVEALLPVLQTLALPNLVTPSPASEEILNLVIATPDGTSPPVDVDLLGLQITTSDIRASLNATTGEGQILGNLVYNVAHLLDPGGSLNLLTILNLLAL